MPETFEERPDLPVLRVRADWNAGGPAAAMARLESKLPSLRGRKFYGAFRVLPEGEEYYACVVRLESDLPEQWELETGVIPGGLYARRKLRDWAKDLSQLGRVFEEMIRATEFDAGRPELEFYRSEQEVVLFVPVLSRQTRKGTE